MLISFHFLFVLVASASKRRNLKMHLRNQELSINPPFTSVNDYDIYIVNQSTETNTLHELIRSAKSSQYFSIDTESDLYTNRPALIQIELIDPNLSTVILIETCHLPLDKTSLKFWLIRSILKFILESNKTIFCWGSPLDELKKFLVYQLYTEEALGQPTMIDIQKEFKLWHFEQVGFFETGSHPWGLQNAIHKMYNEFLNKKERLNTWSQGLYRQRYHPKIQSMIQYATNDCLAVTKVAVSMQLLTVSMSIYPLL